MAADRTLTSSRGAPGRTIETTATVALTVVVLATAAAVVLRGAATAGPAADAGGIATFAPPSEAQEVVATAATATSAAEPGTGDEDGFTVGELAAGEVSAERFDAFWQAEVERIHDAPCPAPTAPGTTVVVVSVGATPPARLGGDYVDYAPLLADARAAAAAACT